MVCKEVMDRVTPGHLREHGLTVERYERMFGARRPPSRSQWAPIGSVSDPSTALVDAVAERLLDEKVWVACVADEVGERMMNGPLRQRLSALITTMLFQRAKVHGESIAILNAGLAELKEEWRIHQGGVGGGPTDTETLIKLVEKAAKIVADSEGAVQATMKPP